MHFAANDIEGWKVTTGNRSSCPDFHGPSPCTTIILLTMLSNIRCTKVIFCILCKQHSANVTNWHWTNDLSNNSTLICLHIKCYAILLGVEGYIILGWSKISMLLFFSSCIVYQKYCLVQQIYDSIPKNIFPDSSKSPSSCKCSDNPSWPGDMPVTHPHGMGLFSRVPCQHRTLKQGLWVLWFFWF